MEFSASFLTSLTFFLTTGSMILGFIGAVIAIYTMAYSIKTDRKIKRQIEGSTIKLVDEIKSLPDDIKFKECLEILSDQTQIREIKNNLLLDPPDSEILGKMVTTFSVISSIYLNDKERDSFTRGINQPSERGRADYILKYIDDFIIPAETLNENCLELCRNNT